MSISGMMRTSVSGMAAQSNRLASVGDNIANASTHGYKRSFVEFSTVVLESGKGSYQPGSVDSQIRYGITQQGGFDYTTSKTDLAVSGNGFLLVSSGPGNDASYLTRAGSFVKDQDGNLVNAGGYYLLGYPLTAGQTPTVSANGTTGLQVVNVSSISLEATPSTNGTFNANLPEDAATVAAGVLPSTNAVGAQYSAKTSLVVVDNIGREVTLDVYYAKTGANTWEMTVFDSSTATAGTTFPYGAAGSAPLHTATLTFNASTGQFASAAPVGPAPGTIQFTVPNGQPLTLEIGSSSELADDFQMMQPSVNGNKPSAVSYVEFSADGKLFAVYGNGARQPIYQIPLATVPSPDNLTPEAGNVYSISSTSGGLQLGFPGSGQFGSIRASQLEKSTVDTATELTTMIESQFAFTANSKVFQTGGELMDVLVNLKR